MTDARKHPLIVRVLARANAGTATVEFVVVAPLLLLLLTGLIQLGWIGDYAIKVANAARAGAQYGALSIGAAGDTQGIQDSAVKDGQNAAGLTAAAAISCQCADGTASQCLQADCPAPNHRIMYINVTATGAMPSFLNYSGLPASIRTITIVRTATMRVAQ